MRSATCARAEITPTTELNRKKLSPCMIEYVVHILAQKSVPAVNGAEIDALFLVSMIDWSLTSCAQ